MRANAARLVEVSGLAGGLLGLLLGLLVELGDVLLPVAGALA